MPPAKLAGRPRIVNKLKKGKAVAVSSKPKQDKKNTATELSKPQQSVVPKERKRRHSTGSLAEATKPQESATSSGPVSSEFHNVKFSVILTKLKKPHLPSSPAESKQTPVFAAVKKRATKSTGIHKPEQLRGKEQNAKKRRATSVPPVHSAKRVKVKHDNLDVPPSQKKIQKPQSSPKSVQLKNKNNTKQLPNAASKPKSKVSDHEVISSTLEDTLAHLPLLKVKSPKVKKKTPTNSSKTVPVSRPILKAAQIKKKAQLPHSKAAVKRAQQILSQRSKTKKPVVRPNKVAKKIVTDTNDKSNVHKLKEFSIQNANLLSKTKFPMGFEPINHKSFWQPSVILKKLEDEVILGLVKSANIFSSSNIKLRTEYQTTDIPTEGKIRQEVSENQALVQQNKGKLPANETNHPSKIKSQNSSDTSLGKSNRTEKQKAMEEPQKGASESSDSGSKEMSLDVTRLATKDKEKAGKKDKIDSLHDNDDTSNTIPQKKVRGRPRRTSVSLKASSEVSQIVSNSELGKSAPQEPDKKKQTAARKPRSQIPSLEELGDPRPIEPEQRSEDVETSISQLSKVEETSVDVKQNKRRVEENSDKSLRSSGNQNIHSKSVEKPNISSQDGSVKRKRRHSEGPDATVKKAKVMPFDNKGNKVSDTNEVAVSSQTETESGKTGSFQKKGISAVKKSKGTPEVEAGINLEINSSHIVDDHQNSTNSAESTSNRMGDKVDKNKSQQKQGLSISFDSIESLGADTDTDSNSSEVTRDATLPGGRQDDSSISERLKLLDPSFIEEANLTELLNSDSSCDNMSWNSLNIIANQKKAEKLQKDFFTLQKNLALLKEAKAKRDELYKDISKKIKDFVVKRVSRSEKV